MPKFWVLCWIVFSYWVGVFPQEDGRGSDFAMLSLSLLSVLFFPPPPDVELTFLNVTTGSPSSC